MQTITCTNPVCQTTISVPAGAPSVTCPACNTWHFVSEEDLSAPADFGEVGMPPVNQNFDNEKPLIPVYEEMVAPKNTQEVINLKQPKPIGFLETSEGERFNLKEGKNIIGRKSGDILIDNKTVSRRHCGIEVLPKADKLSWEYAIFDIGHLEEKESSNGVFLSNRTIRLKNSERVIVDYEIGIRLGKVQLTLKIQ